MSRYVFDIETDGFLDVLTQVHCLVIKDVDTEAVWSCHDHYGEGPGPSILYGLQMLANAEEIIGQNVIKFDIPAIQKVYPWFKPKGRVTDTLVLARLIWPDTKPRDARLIKDGKLPGKFRGKHSLEAWGYRLGVFKGEYTGTWEAWSQEMQDYCEQDVEATHALWYKVQEKNYSAAAIDLEHEVAWLMAQMERNGFPFDEAAGATLYAELVGKRDALWKQLTNLFAPWWVKEGEHVPAKTLNYKDPQRASVTAGAAYSKVTLVQFNPGSRQHIANRLTAIHGWQPQDFTDNGQAKIDETVLEKLDYPEAKLLAEYFLLEKRIGQLAEGSEAWLKVVKDGRIHGGINPNGAVTGRATHMRPNISATPKVKSRYGKECRALFHTGPADWVLMGSDASGLELRCLAHFLARWDDGAYAKTVVEGVEEDETDVHSVNAKLLGFAPKQTYVVNGKQRSGRDIGKTFIYAYLYGAGDAKLFSITGLRNTKSKFARALPALRELKAAIEKACARGYIKGIDGRHLEIRSPHAALNTLLQSAGALICKRWITLFERAMQARGFVHGWHGDYALCAWVHDEIQVACKKEIANEVGRIAVECVREAGRHFNWRCPTDGTPKVGRTWRDTH